MTVSTSDGEVYDSHMHMITDQTYQFDPKDQTDAFNTPLEGDKASMYNQWTSEQLGKSGRDLSKDTYNYDMQGYFAGTRAPVGGNMDVTPDSHFPDTYKKPSHPTFSNESKYHGIVTGDLPVRGQKPTEGGQWDKMEDGSYSFTPGRTNLRYHTPQELIDYFKKHEPGNTLILPGSDSGEFKTAFDYPDRPMTNLDHHRFDDNKTVYQWMKDKLDPNKPDIGKLKNWEKNMEQNQELNDKLKGEYQIPKKYRSADSGEYQVAMEARREKTLSPKLQDVPGGGYAPQPSSNAKPVPVIEYQGKMYKGDNHIDAIDKASKATGHSWDKILESPGLKDGFQHPKTGKYMDRTDALNYAMDKNQIHPDMKGIASSRKGFSNSLTSEDLNPDTYLQTPPPRGWYK